MQGWKKYRKFAAFIPAVILVGGFVGYRAGAFERFTKTEPQPDPGANTQPQPASEGDPAFMAGSKSFRPVIAIPPASESPAAPPSPAPNSATPGKPPTIMYGSKSAPVEIPLPM